MAQGNHSLARRNPGDLKYALLRQRLVEARLAAKLTQQELADQLNRQQSFVAKYEVGERYLDAVELIVVADILNIDLAGLAAQILGSPS